MKWLLRLFTILVLLCFTSGMSAQESDSGDMVEEEVDSTKRTRIQILNTDLFEFITTDSNQVRKFKGNVHFRHEGTDFFCNRAIQYMDTEIVVADGDVHIQKPDSFDVWSDHLVYYSKLKIAEFRGNVIFQDSTSRLSTDSLDYDLNTDIGYFWSGGTLENDSTLLTSERGTYYHRSREAIFHGNVHLSNPEFDLYSDSMRYDSREQIAYFIAPTKIVNGEDVIYTNSGYYDTRTNKAHFGGHTEMTSGSNKISANVLNYDKEAGYGEATGNVVWEDTSEQITIVSNYAEYFDSLDYVLATMNPLMIDVNGEDTMYMSADTLITFKLPVNHFVQEVMIDSSATLDSSSSYQLLDTLSLIGNIADSLPTIMEMIDTTIDTNAIVVDNDSLRNDYVDSIRVFYAYSNAKLLNGRMSAVCDSMYFSESDSIFRLHGDPLVWVDTTQFSGDSMWLVLKNKALDRIKIYKDAIILHESSPGIYDQTKGKLVTGIFKDDELKLMEIEGNGESIYFIQDDSMAYVGGNKSVCSKMIIYMRDSVNEVDHITFFTKPEATFTPFNMINLSSYLLEGFNWRIELKPNSVYDIVRYLPLYHYYLRLMEERSPSVVNAEENISVDGTVEDEEIEVKDHIGEQEE